MSSYLIIVVTRPDFCTQFAVDSIDALSSKAKVSKPFIGLSLLAISNNDFTLNKHAIEDHIRTTIKFYNRQIPADIAICDGFGGDHKLK